MRGEYQKNFMDCKAQAHHVELMVATAFHDAGLEVTQWPEYIHTETPQSMPNQKDMYVEGQRIEVKSKKDEVDPLPYNGICVGNVSSWEHYDPLPRAVVIVSRKSWNMVAVSPKSKHLWWKQDMKQPARGFSLPAWMCPNNCIHPFSALVDALKRERCAS